MTSTSETRRGLLYGVGAYLWWGFSPIYFKAVDQVAPDEILAQRIVWSLVLLLGLLARRGTLGEVRAVAARPRLLATLAASTVLVAVNWFTFIWAVTHARILEASLGYFVTPLVNVMLGLVFLRERLRRLQWLSLALAVAGVAVRSTAAGGLPIVSLTLAGSFGLYGLVRKQTPVGGVVGLTVETGLLAPLALGFLIWLETAGRLGFGHAGPGTTVLLAASGLVTAVPLVWFANAARRLRYATVGFLQYLAPTFQFLLAVLAYREPFSTEKLLSFALIWLALGVYTTDAVRSHRRPGGAGATATDG